MNKNILRRAFILSLIPGFALASACYAGEHGLNAENCKLGSTCNIPGNDGGETYYSITPASGQKYKCDLKSKGDSLKIWVGDGKDFNFEKGGGYYNVNSTMTIEVSGRFKQPDDPNDVGQIKFKKLPLSSEGEVKCYASK